MRCDHFRLTSCGRARFCFANPLELEPLRGTGRGGLPHAQGVLQQDGACEGVRARGRSLHGVRTPCERFEACRPVLPLSTARRLFEHHTA
eukprot:2546991-Pyramimonas_sp.AAC.2